MASQNICKGVPRGTLDAVQRWWWARGMEVRAHTCTNRGQWQRPSAAHVALWTWVHAKHRYHWL